MSAPRRDLLYVCPKIIGLEYVLKRNKMTMEERQDIIDRYLTQRMTAEEAAAFEADMKNDENLRRETEFTRHLMEEMADRRQRMQRMEEWDKKARKRHRLRLTVWISGIAAALVIAFLLATPLFKTDETDKLAHIEANASRGSSSFGNIRELINSGNYEDAMNRIEAEKSQNSAERIKVESDGTLNDGQRSYKLTVVQAEAEELLWMEAHALIGLHKKEEASKLLAQLIKEKGFYSAQADSLLKLLP